ncbi:hypothetical protein RN001_002834 [Aquatica leii]|uniref:Uncharacterized protein n=1 Tax=Aquatica leii TaxID=1421715 RepID=A0AAN7QNR2_9COLE|nr:hypothetical protein RN001_002834 [Aquatica leii]
MRLTPSPPRSCQRVLDTKHTTVEYSKPLRPTSNCSNANITPSQNIDNGFDETQKEFYKEILRKLNLLISKVNYLEKKIDSCSKGNSNISTTDDCIDNINVFPLKTEIQLNIIEDKLKTDVTYSKKVVNNLKGSGGSHVQNVTVNILKRLFPNVIANKFILQREKKKGI